MKKIFNLITLAGLLVSMAACRDESLNPLPVWDYGVHGFLVFDGIPLKTTKVNNIELPVRPQPFELDYANSYPLTSQDGAKVPMKVRWVSLDNKLTVNKVEIYVRMEESYNDPDGNPKVADLSGNGKGKLYTSLTPAGNRQWSAFTVEANKVYELYKNATVKYDKVNATPVFSNPSRPRPAGERFRGSEKATYGSVGSDEFIVTFVLYTSDGKKFETFNPDSICADPTPYSEAASNCQMVFDVY